MNTNIKLAAPEIDRLIQAYDRFQNPEQPSKALMEAMAPPSSAVRIFFFSSSSACRRYSRISSSDPLFHKLLTIIS
jgi:hypothetical protein